MIPEVVRKLESEINSGISTEIQAVYVLTCVRKILEQQEARDQYKFLSFHCDWALHSKLNGRMAQEILCQFDAANIQLRSGVELHQLPAPLRKYIDRISKMETFREEFEQFLDSNGLPHLDHRCADGWARFLHLYTEVVADCPLVMQPSARATIAKVTVNIEEAARPPEGQILFKVTWAIADINGLSGSLFVINSYTPSRRIAA